MRAKMYDSYIYIYSYDVTRTQAELQSVKRALQNGARLRVITAFVTHVLLSSSVLMPEAAAREQICKISKSDPILISYMKQGVSLHPTFCRWTRYEHGVCFMPSL